MITIVPPATATAATTAGLATAATPLLPIVGVIVFGIWLLSDTEMEPDALDIMLGSD